MADDFLLTIVTPERSLFSGRVVEFVAPGIMGEFGVLPGHAHMLAELDVGWIRFKKEGDEYRIAAGGGFAEVTGEKVTVLLDKALFLDEIIAEEMREAFETQSKLEYAPQDEQYLEWQISLKWISMCLQFGGDPAKRAS